MEQTLNSDIQSDHHDYDKYEVGSPQHGLGQDQDEFEDQPLGSSTLKCDDKILLKDILKRFLLIFGKAFTIKLLIVVATKKLNMSKVLKAN